MLRWTQSALPTHLLWFPVPASASVPLLLFLLHIRWWTFFLALAVCIGLAVLRHKGRTAVWVVRRFQFRMGGNVIYSRPLWYRRRMQRSEGFDLLDIEKVRGK